ELQGRDQRREILEVSADELSPRERLPDEVAAWIGLPRDQPEDLVALLVQELGEVLAVLARDARDERARHERRALGHELDDQPLVHGDGERDLAAERVTRKPAGDLPFVPLEVR